MQHIYIVEYTNFSDETGVIEGVFDDTKNINDQALKLIKEEYDEGMTEDDIKDVWKVSDEDVLSVAKNLLDFNSK